MTLTSGKSDLRFTADAPPEALMASVMDSDPRLMWFLQSYRYEKRGRDYHMFFTYRNRDTNLHDVKVAKSMDACFSFLCSALSSHARALVVCVKKEMDVEMIVDLLNRKYAAAYPNLSSFHTATHSFEGSFVALAFTFSYRVGGVHLAVWEKECDTECKRVADMLFLPDMPPVVKIFLAHNYLSHTVTYDKNGSPDTMFTAYGAMCLHKCVCHGIADAMRRLLKYGAVPCEIILGQARGENHAWNLVKTEAGWHHLDATWDLSEGRGIRYDYFLKADADIVPYRNYDRSLYPAMVSGERLKKAVADYIAKHRWELLKQGVDKKILGD